MDDEKIRDIFKDDSLSDTVSQCFNAMREQQRLFQTTTLIKDIIRAYKGKITWDEYLKERKSANLQIRTQNNYKKIINLKENNYTLNYQVELPILDFESFMIAEQLGKLDRGEE